MNEIPVLLAVTSTARYDADDAAEPIRTMTSGVLTQNGSVYHLKYTESLQDDTGATLSREVSMEITRSRVTLQSIGPYGMTMVLQKGLHYDGIYHTPFGEMPISVQTIKLQSDPGTTKGSLKATYQMTTQGAFASMIDLELNWRARAAH